MGCGAEFEGVLAGMKQCFVGGSRGSQGTRGSSSTHTHRMPRMHTLQAVVNPECDKDLRRVCYPCASTLLLHSCRSLSQALDLFEAKSHCMPQPDALITAVGTHVHWWDGRRQQWVEDGGWREVMQQGWSEQAVRAAVDTAMGKVGSGGLVGLRGMLQRRWSAQVV